MAEGSGDFSIGSQVWPGLSKLLEEMGELQQVGGKLMGTGGKTAHWDGTDLRQRLIEEMSDVLAAIQFFQAKNFTDKDDDRIRARVSEKLQLFATWHNNEEAKREKTA